ncbi:MAG: response regulator transcription factor [Actinomycetota bacterium]|nr:response regulator [Actinomycetota bacterium]
MTNVRPRTDCPRVLIVDDDSLIRDLVKTVLEDENYILEEAHDGRQALDLAREHVPDIVLLDVMMPGLNGFVVARELRRDLGPDCVIIMLSACDQASDKDEGIRAGANAYFTKPFHPLELLDAVAEAANGRL